MDTFDDKRTAKLIMRNDDIAHYALQSPVTVRETDTI